MSATASQSGWLIAATLTDSIAARLVDQRDVGFLMLLRLPRLRIVHKGMVCIMPLRLSPSRATLGAAPL